MLSRRIWSQLQIRNSQITLPHSQQQRPLPNECEAYRGMVKSYELEIDGHSAQMQLPESADVYMSAKFNHAT